MSATPLQKFKIGMLPMTSTDDVGTNIDQLRIGLKYFEQNPVHLISTPENTFYFNFESQLNPNNALRLDHPVWEELSLWCGAQSVYLHIGGTPLWIDGSVYNASVLVAPGVAPQVVYKKIHLFDVNVEGRKVCESQSFSAGEELAILDIMGWRWGLAICYDLRFAEMFIQYHRHKVDGILVPASFLVPTGRAHWSTLLKARAIETQSFLVASAQVGVHASLNSQLAAKQTWGQSLCIDPWGRILAETPSFDQQPAPTPIVVELDHSVILQTRQQIPLLSHRKRTL